MHEMHDIDREHMHEHEHFEVAQPSGFLTEAESSYPEIFHRVMPFISEKAAMISDPWEITERDINRMADEVMNESGIIMNPPRGHSNESMRDVVKMLMTAEIDRMYEATSTLQPFVGAPFFFGWPWWWGRPGWRHRGWDHRGRDHGRWR